jgi:hypothetical protein
MTRHVEQSISEGQFRLYRWLLGATAIAAVVVTVVAGIAATEWTGKPFPGFFVFSNRVVPSIGLPGWAVVRNSTLYQRAVVSVDGQPVADGAQVYRHVNRRPIGSAVTYGLQEGPETDTLTIRSEAFSRADYWAIFGTYLGTGFLYLTLGLLGAWLFPGTHLGYALLLVGGTGGVYMLSAVGIYDPDGSLRIHALAEAFFPAAVVYLGLVFPRERLRLVRPGVAVASWISVGIGIPYQFLLDQPGAYSVMHAASETYLGLASFALTVSLVVHYTGAENERTPLLRSVTAGVFLGLAVPAVVMTISGLSGGRLPVNICTATAFLFPLCFSYGLIRGHLTAEPIPRHIVVPLAGAPS